MSPRKTQSLRALAVAQPGSEAMTAKQLSRGIFLLIGLLVTVLNRNAILEKWHHMNEHSINKNALPVLVQNVLRCFEKLHNRNFYPMGFLLRSGGHYQRLVEAAWPVEVGIQSNIRVFWKNDLPSLCKNATILCSEGDGIVARCSL